MQRRARISLNSLTEEALNWIRAPGQNYDGIIQQLIKLWNEQNKQNLASGRRSYGDYSSPRDIS